MTVFARSTDRARQAAPRMPAGENPLPTFLIAGAQRCGTTTLARLLGSHPRVFVAKEKEVRFFSEQFERGLDWYRSRFAGASTDETVIGEASPEYMYLEDASDRISEVLPTVKLIIVMRDPVDRAYSHYWLNRARGREELSFEEAIIAEAERIERDTLSRVRYSYLDRGRYVLQLERLARWLPRDRVLLLAFSDLQNDPTSCLRDAFGFLGVEEEFRPPNVTATINPYVEFRSLRLRSIAQKLPGRAGRLLGRLNVRQGAYPPMSDETRRVLSAEFAPLNARLEERFAFAHGWSR